MSDRPKPDIDALMADGKVIDEAIKQAVREAVRRHKLLGNPIAVWRGEKVVWLQPEEIDLGDDEGEAGTKG
jgi:hypothetical protein